MDIHLAWNGPVYTFFSKKVMKCMPQSMHLCVEILKKKYLKMKQNAHGCCLYVNMKHMFWFFEIVVCTWNQGLTDLINEKNTSALDQVSLGFNNRIWKALHIKMSYIDTETPKQTKDRFETQLCVLGQINQGVITITVQAMKKLLYQMKNMWG